MKTLVDAMMMITKKINDIEAFNLRRSRYIGIAKTHLQHLVIACSGDQY
jgi:hypothetical protein